MPDLLALFDVGFFAALVRISTPLLLATLGELYSERSGVLNLGIEGIMLLGAMVGFTVAYETGSLWLGVLAALATGAVAGLVMALLAVVLGVSQHVSGIGMTLLATGLAFYFYRLIFGQPSVPPNVVAFAATPIPFLAESRSSARYSSIRRYSPISRSSPSRYPPGCCTARPGASTCAPSARTRAPPTPPVSACGACAPRRWSSAAR